MNEGDTRARSGVAPSAARRIGGMAAAIGAVALFWLVSNTIVATWLERDALARAQLWMHDATPWRWDFSQGAEISWPGSSNVELLGIDARGTRLRIDPPAGAITLRLRGERIDAVLPAAVRIDATAAQPVRMHVLAEREARFEAWASADIGATPPGRVPLAPIDAAPLEGLQLHVETAAPTELVLRSFDILPAQVLAPGVCATSASVDDTLARCGVRLARFVAPPSATTDTLLWWRDALLMQRPAAVVTAALGGLSLASWLPLQAMPWMPWAFAGLAVLLVACAIVLRRCPAPRSRGRAAGELALVLAVPLLLLAGGWPGDDVPLPIGVAFACALATALMLRNPDPDWTAWGDARGRRAIGVFTLLAGGALLALGLWLAEAGHERVLVGDRVWRYALWAGLQQWLLLTVIAPRTRRVVGARVAGGGVPQASAGAAMLAGALFALLHLPNFGLMVATFIGGTAWAWFGYRYRALVPLVASHALLGLLLVGNLPAWLLRSAEVGGRYLMAP